MKYYFFIRLVSYEYKLQQIIKITIIHKIEKIRKKYTRCTCTTQCHIKVDEHAMMCDYLTIFVNHTDQFII